MTKARKRMLKVALFLMPPVVCALFVAHFLNGEATADQSGNIVKNASFEQEAGGTYMQCESVSLSREVPFVLQMIVGSFVTGVPRESLAFTLNAARQRLKR